MRRPAGGDEPYHRPLGDGALQDNPGALEGELSAGDHQRLDEVAEPGRASASYYQADFGPSVR